jgi:hypothetical protein
LIKAEPYTVTHTEKSAMKKQTFAFALIATSFGLGTLFSQGAVAQEGAPPEAAPPAPAAAEDEKELAVLPEFKKVDANEDGMIDSTEAVALAETLEEEHQIVFEFRTVDENADGLINDQEYVAYDGMLAERLGIA